ncbi:X-linked retinitis pigmentosa GTPase regulator-interacting protein 1 [Rhinatrema bivittatum]|uniref:X-linked retinitis pigmentosa GTPase regulator-interacting protein 1 n=1 Tax=Rhinatrema bivittatum TaxID=194408 RepID=UPI0011269695|nr:X-linked retinitis pigmentosa GTPase regulator-interacting protein 1 [Rhinatrema bivittatum]
MSLVDEDGGRPAHVISSNQPSQVPGLRSLKGKDVGTRARQSAIQVTRGDLEDSFLRLREENLVLKVHAGKQESTIKRMGVKLLRLASERQRAEDGKAPRARPRVPGAEDAVEDLRERLRALEWQNEALRSRLSVCKQQLQVRGTACRHCPYASVLARVNSGLRRTKTEGQLAERARKGEWPSLERSEAANRVLEAGVKGRRMVIRGVGSLSKELHMREPEVRSAPQTAPPRYEDRLTKEERAEVQRLVRAVQEQRGRTAELEPELRKTWEERACEESSSFPHLQQAEAHRMTICENVEVIRLRKLAWERRVDVTAMKERFLQLKETYETQLQERQQGLTSANTALLAQVDGLSARLQEERHKVMTLESQLGSMSILQTSLREFQERVEDLEKERGLLREGNEHLLKSIMDTVHLHNWKTTEKELQHEISWQQEELSSALAVRREALEALDAVEKERGHNEELKQEVNRMKLLLLRQKQEVETHHQKEEAILNHRTARSTQTSRSLDAPGQPSPPCNGRGEEGREPEKDGDRIENPREKFLELEAAHAETVLELEKTRDMLILQYKINQDYQAELEAVTLEAERRKREREDEAERVARLLDLRSARVRQLQGNFSRAALGFLPGDRPGSPSSFPPPAGLGSEVMVHGLSRHTVPSSPHQGSTDNVSLCSFPIWLSSRKHSMQPLSLSHQIRKPSLFSIQLSSGSYSICVAYVRRDAFINFFFPPLHHSPEQLKDIAYGARPRPSLGAAGGMECSGTKTPPLLRGEDLFELHLHRAFLTPEALRERVGEPCPATFLTYSLYDFETHCTPVVAGAEPLYDFTSRYAVRGDPAFLRYLRGASARLDLHQALGTEHRLLGGCRLQLNVVLETRERILLFLLWGLHPPCTPAVAVFLLFSVEDDTEIQAWSSILHPFPSPSGTSREELGILEYWMRLHRPMGQAVHQSQEREEALGYLAATLGSRREPLRPEQAHQEPCSLPAPEGERNELLVQISGCRALRSRRPGSAPHPYATYRFYDFPEHDTPTIPGSRSPQFGDSTAFPVRVTCHLDRYLRLGALQLYVFDEEEPDLGWYLGKTRVPLLPLAHGRDIKGRTLGLFQVPSILLSAGKQEIPNPFVLYGLPDRCIPRALSAPCPGDSISLSSTFLVFVLLSPPGDFSLKAPDGSPNGSISLILEWKLPYRRPGWPPPTQADPVVDAALETLTEEERQGGSPEPRRAPHTPAESGLWQSAARKVKSFQRSHTETFREHRVALPPRRATAERPRKAAGEQRREKAAVPSACGSPVLSVPEGSGAGRAAEVAGAGPRQPLLETKEDGGPQHPAPRSDEGTASEGSGKRTRSTSYEQAAPLDASTDSDEVIVVAGRQRRPKLQSDQLRIEVVSLTLDPRSQVAADERVQQVYVEYHFPGLPPVETETPCSLRKPTAGEEIHFNYSRVINVDREENKAQREGLAALLEEGGGKLMFTVVSEPLDELGEEECQDVGYAFLDLAHIARHGRDVAEKALDICSVPAQEAVIGTLKVAVEAAAALDAVQREKRGRDPSQKAE